MNSTITAVPGITAGHFTNLMDGTGCTVVIAEEGAIGGVDVRGGSPGTRETDLLRPLHRVEHVHAISLSGGSAFGLEAASGIMRHLAEKGVGLHVAGAIIPIVASAILFDLGMLNPSAFPSVEDGRAACMGASLDPLPQGTVGAGTGATVGKVLGIDRAVKSGIGSSCIQLPSGPKVAALVAVNAIGGIVDYQNATILAGPRNPDTQDYHDSVNLLLDERLSELTPPLSNTTIGIVATDAKLTKDESNFIAQVSHDGLAMTIRPCHTIRDGDTMFTMATCLQPKATDLTTLCAAAVEATAQAVINAVKFATSLGGIPSIGEI